MDYYSKPMTLNLRRIAAVLLFVAIGLGTPGFDAQASGITEDTALAAADLVSTSHCAACGGNEMAVSKSTCLASCIGVQAITKLAEVSVQLRAYVFYPPVERPLCGSRSAPDPFPPRPNILA